MGSSAQVIIVGAGPTGAALAWLLSRHGIPVCLVEAKPMDRQPFRGQALMPSGLAALEAMDIPLNHIPHRPLRAWEFWLDGKLLFRAQEPLGSPFPCTLIDPTALVAQLLRQAQGSGYLVQQFGIPVVDLLWQGERVVGVKLADGQALTGQLVVAADGRASPLRQLAGLTVKKSGSPLTVHWYRLPVSAAWLRDNVFCTCLGERQLLAVFQGADPECLSLAWVGRGSLDLQTWLPYVPPALAEHFRHRGDQLSGPTTITAQAGYCPRWWRPGLLLLGDAAHPMSPVRAQGINMSLRDVIVASNHILNQWGSLAWDLRGVEAERRPEIRRIQRLQAQETRQGELLRTLPGLRPALLPWGSVLKQIWIRRQRPLRQGITSLQLLSKP
ncbi:MAG: FAD-dependent monooxygenase [Thermostichales cyanobacterium GMQP_bins_62]